MVGFIRLVSLVRLVLVIVMFLWFKFFWGLNMVVVFFGLSNGEVMLYVIVSFIFDNFWLSLDRLRCVSFVNFVVLGEIGVRFLLSRCIFKVFNIFVLLLVDVDLLILMVMLVVFLCRVVVIILLRLWLDVMRLCWGVDCLDIWLVFFRL